MIVIISAMGRVSECFIVHGHFNCSYPRVTLRHNGGRDPNPQPKCGQTGGDATVRHNLR